VQEETVVGQVLLQRVGAGWSLRHVEDRSEPEAKLRLVAAGDLREVAQSTAEGAFRPLKSAPNLIRGWLSRPGSAVELGVALDHLYPGFVADWDAFRKTGPALASDFHTYAERQTGMYRIVAMLKGEQAARVVRAHCGKRFCLKHRAWTVEGLAPEESGKSVIPCLEPCALLMEFARKAMRLEQADQRAVALPAEEWEAVEQILREALDRPKAGLREADFGEGTNPRRLQLILEKLAPAEPKTA